MDLNDFGTECDTSHRVSNHHSGLYPHNHYSTHESASVPIQWKVATPGVYEACGTTHPRLPAGAYGCSLNQYGEPQFLVKDLQVDDLIDFADSLPAKILAEIDSFWEHGETFRRYGYLHRRGYLRYGPLGSG